jgi:O-antigen/teichoic acid export membrane protein
MAIAVMAGNVLALVYTVVFARKLGQTGYGSLSALISTYIILMVPGAAVQTTVAREVSAAYAAGDPEAGAGVRRWLEGLVAVLVVVTAISVIGRHVLAAVIGVKDVPWAAAATLPSGCLWLMLSIERGALQGFHRYRMVGASWIAEAVARLLFALVLVGAGAGVSGAFLGTPLSLATLCLILLVPLARQLPRGDRGAHPLKDLFVRAGVPVAALALVAWMQDGNVIIVKHIATGRQAGSYAAAAVAAKAIMWVAVGLALYLVPEAARRARLRQHPTSVLTTTLGLIALVGTPMVLLYAAAGRTILRVAFGHKFIGAAGALPWLGIALCLLACTYLAVQYHLALHRWRFIGLLIAAAIAQPLVLIAIGPHLTPIALGLLAVNGALAVGMVTLALRVRPSPSEIEIEEEPQAQPAPALSVE